MWRPVDRRGATEFPGHGVSEQSAVSAGWWMWYTSAVPRRPRQVHARPRIPAPDASPFLKPHPLTPLADREPRPWFRRRRAGAIAVAATGIVVAIPLLGAALAPGAPSLRPLAGGEVGAVSEPQHSATPADAPEVTPRIDPRLATVHATDADGPVAFAERGPTPVAGLTGYRWPIAKGRISLPFKAIPGGEWINNGTLYHDGVDMASFCGAPVVAAHAGTVLAAGRRFDDFIGWIGDLGPYKRRLDARHGWGSLPIVVVIDDGNGYRSIYAHFRDVTVKVGQRVRAGQLIGHEGATGHASGCHVHYGLFSPLETKVFGLRSDIRKRMRLPATEIARIDPLLVLPRGDVALRTRQIGKAIDAIAADAAAAKARSAAAAAARGNAGAAPS